MTISGNFQSPLYFQDMYGTLCNEIDLLSSGMVSPTTCLNDDGISAYVGVHVRRGDYLALNGFDMVDRDRYYHEALSLMGRMFPEINKVLVFSDDIEWCKTQACFEGAIFCDSDNNAPYNDLFILSQCGGVIIANSSFSWWAGWFASRRGSPVIAPKTWLFGHSTESLKLLPDGWLSV